MGYTNSFNPYKMKTPKEQKDLIDRIVNDLTTVKHSYFRDKKVSFEIARQFPRDKIVMSSDKHSKLSFVGVKPGFSLKKRQNGKLIFLQE